MSSVVLFIVGCEAAGALSALLAGTANNSWYRKLKKPGWNPPSWLFGPVWVVLYALMGVAGYIVYAEPASASRSLALVLFALQLSHVNAL